MTQYLWVEKYRPDTIENFIGNEQLKAKVSQFIKTGDVPHLLLSGPPGTGKTTAAKMITKNIECDVLYINASDENSVDVMRNKIKNFASSVGFKPLKVVILDEADYITPNAQAALRNLMETFSKTTRFILTCNFVERIIDPIVSRTQQFQIIPPSKIDVAKHVWDILQQEGVTADKNDFKLLIDAHYPDIRKIINECQLAVTDGKLTISPTEIVGRDHKLKIIEVLSSKADGKSKFQTIRQIIADAKIRDFADLYALLYSRVEEYAPNNISGTILAIAEGQYRDVSVPDKEINMMATLIQVLQAAK
jgi:replication factor C small subunit